MIRYVMYSLASAFVAVVIFLAGFFAGVWCSCDDEPEQPTIEVPAVKVKTDEDFTPPPVPKQPEPPPVPAPYIQPAKPPKPDPAPTPPPSRPFRRQR